MGSVQPPSMQCAAYNKLDTGVHGLSHVVVGHIGLVVHNNAQHDTQQHSLCPHAATTSLPARSNIVSARTQQHRLCPHAATPSLQIIHVTRDKDTFFKNRFGTMSSQERGRAALDTKMKKVVPRPQLVSKVTLPSTRVLSKYCPGGVNTSINSLSDLPTWCAE